MLIEQATGLSHRSGTSRRKRKDFVVIAVVRLADARLSLSHSSVRRPNALPHSGPGAGNGSFLSSSLSIEHYSLPHLNGYVNSHRLALV